MPLLVVWHISEHINVTFQLVYCNCKCKLLFFSRASDKERTCFRPSCVWKQYKFILSTFLWYCLFNCFSQTCQTVMKLSGCISFVEQMITKEMFSFNSHQINSCPAFRIMVAVIHVECRVMPLYNDNIANLKVENIFRMFILHPF